MTLRSLISFDHALLTTANTITPQTTYGANVLQSTYGLPGTMMTGASSNGAVIQSNGWLYFGASNASFYTSYTISFADLGLLQGGATQCWIGFRTYANGTAPGTCNVVGLISAISQLGSVGSGITSMLTETQLNRLGAGVTFAQYVECFFDTVALTYQTYVNGIQVASGSIPSGMQYVVFSGQAYSGTWSQYYRDFYFLDVDATKPNARLGPITSTALTPSVSGTLLPNYGNFIGLLSGSAAASVALSKFGGSSLSPGATASSAVAIPDNPNLRTGATGDVTYECWVYNTSVATTAGLFGKDPNAGSLARLLFVGGNWQLYTDGTSTVMNVASGMVANTWYHIALVRYNGVWTLYQNGVVLATYATSTTFGNTASTLYIGNSVALNAPWQGYVDEFRMSNMARYTAAFTPPAAQFSPDANTVLLMHFNSQTNGYVADSSSAQPSGFQTAQAAAFAMTPFVQNAASNDAMSLNYQSSVPAGQKIVAMQFKMAAQVPFAMNLLASLQETGQSTKTLSPYLFRDVLANYGRDLAGIQALAPDGLAWTAASLAATNLVLQPQSTTAGSTN